MSDINFEILFSSIYYLQYFEACYILGYFNDIWSSRILFFTEFFNKFTVKSCLIEKQNLHLYKEEHRIKFIYEINANL